MMGTVSISISITVIVTVTVTITYAIPRSQTRPEGSGWNDPGKWIKPGAEPGRNLAVGI